MIILKQQQDIAALTNEMNSLKCLVETMVMANKDSNKDEEVIKINIREKHCDTDNTIQTKITEKLLQCKVCDYSCEKEITLNKHTNTKHQTVNNENAGRKKFHCHECDSSFTTKKGLKKHEAIHNDTMKLKCETCAKEFGKRDALDEHIHKEHKIRTDWEEYPEVGDDELDEWVAKAAKAAENHNE